MILIDIGNTNIVFAVSSNNKIKKISRIDTNKENKILIKNINKIIKNFLDKNISKNSKKFAVISSVVPHINTHIIKILNSYKIKTCVLKPKDVSSFLNIFASPPVRMIFGLNFFSSIIFLIMPLITEMYPQ